MIKLCVVYQRILVHFYIASDLLYENGQDFLDEQKSSKLIRAHNPVEWPPDPDPALRKNGTSLLKKRRIQILQFEKKNPDAVTDPISIISQSSTNSDTGPEEKKRIRIQHPEKIRTQALKIHRIFRIWILSSAISIPTVLYYVYF